ncbi:MAG: DNA-3-methyladenine glycosylase I [Bacilli bacterium]
MKRCSWVNLSNPIYVKYHDEEWCVPKYDDQVLFELLTLEIFQAGLSWETILKKRESFRLAFDFFDIEKISEYKDNKIIELMNNKNIIRNIRKINATINNAIVFKNIINEYGSFSNYIWGKTNNLVVVNDSFITKNELSDEVTFDLKNKGMKFIGTTIIYSYLQAIGIVNSHEIDCFKSDYNL